MTALMSVGNVRSYLDHKTVSTIDTSVVLSSLTIATHFTTTYQIINSLLICCHRMT